MERESSVERSERSTPRWGWERACVAFALSLFPGCGHFYVGLPHRAAAWSLIYLLVFVPASLAGYVLWSSDASVYAGLILAFLLFFLTCATGPTLYALRGPRGSLARAHARPFPPLHLLGTYAFVIHLLGSVEVAWFRHDCFAEFVVEGTCLQPLLTEGATARVLVSPYVRPVHGEVVLMATPQMQGSSVPGRRLGRVLAKPHDTVAWEAGRLAVNGIALDLDTTLPRRRLEQRGRRARRLRLFSAPPLLSEYEGLGAQKPDLWPSVDWSGAAAGPWRLGAQSYLVLPDNCGVAATVKEGATDIRFAAGLVPETHVLGRVVY